MKSEWNLEAVQAAQARVAAAKPIKAAQKKVSAPETPLQRMQGLGRLPKGKMNDSEAAYSRHLENRKHAGEILWWAFEPINIRLADNTFYKVDFCLLLANGEFQCHEYKGYWTAKARVKTKVASKILPFQFIGITKEKGQFKFEYF